MMLVQTTVRMQTAKKKLTDRLATYLAALGGRSVLHTYANS